MAEHRAIKHVSSLGETEAQMLQAGPLLGVQRPCWKQKSSQSTKGGLRPCVFSRPGQSVLTPQAGHCQRAEQIRTGVAFCNAQLVLRVSWGAALLGSTLPSLPSPILCGGYLCRRLSPTGQVPGWKAGHRARCSGNLFIWLRSVQGLLTLNQSKAYVPGK